MSTLSERITSTEEGKKVWHQERLIFEATERLCELLEERGLSRTQFARLMGTTKGYVSQLLDGESNMTLRTLSDAFLALGRAAYIGDSPVSIDYPAPNLLHFNPEWGENGSPDSTPTRWTMEVKAI